MTWKNCRCGDWSLFDYPLIKIIYFKKNFIFIFNCKKSNLEGEKLSVLFCCSKWLFCTFWPEMKKIWISWIFHRTGIFSENPFSSYSAYYRYVPKIMKIVRADFARKKRTDGHRAEMDRWNQPCLKKNPEWMNTLEGICNLRNI